MESRRIVIPFLILLFLLPLTSCTRDPGNGGNADPNPDLPPGQATLAGLALGDPVSKVLDQFGSQYTEEIISAEDSPYGEDASTWNYGDRIFVTVGQASQTVQRIYVAAPEYETNLGVSVGQRADAVLPIYRNHYEESVHPDSNEILYGCFQVENGGFLLFSFRDGNEMVAVGSPISDEAVVERILLGDSIASCLFEAGNNGSEEPDPDLPPEQTTLAGLALGDPVSKVLDQFGSQYTEETISAEDSYYGEDVSTWNYGDRIFVTIGQTSQTVQRIYVTVPEYNTNLGVSVGQRADAFLPTYQGFYEELVSYHSDDTLYGWFLVENGGILIFYFSDENGIIPGGTTIPDHAVVDDIVLAYLMHFD